MAGWEIIFRTQMKVIRDSIHGDVFLTDLEFDIIDTPEFQRLRRIKQLGTTYLVYPSANHTRFEHSIGALHLAGRIADRLMLPDEERRNVRIAAILHDIGHGPLSHSSEELLSRYLGLSHENIAVDIIINDSNISKILEKNGIEPATISRIISEDSGYLSKIISSEFDVDRMDYLVRDAHHTGVAYGIIDLDRLINTLEISGNSLAVNERGLKAVEALLVARFLMIPTVYLHHTSRIADAMFFKATEVAVEEGYLDFCALCKMDDYDILNLFRSSRGYVKDIGRRFDERRLFKTAYTRSWYEIDKKVKNRIIGLRKNIKKWNTIEDQIAEDYNIEKGYVLLDIPQAVSLKEMDIKIIKDNQLTGIDRESPLVRILKETQKAQWSFNIYTLKEDAKRISGIEIESYLL